MKLRPAFVGIDVAFAKQKRLPICVCTVREDGSLKIRHLRKLAPPPAGRGNVAALDPAIRKQFSEDVAGWLQNIEKELELSVRRIAIDSPSDYCRQGLKERRCESALREAGIRYISTPTKRMFSGHLAKARLHLQRGGKVVNLPHSNQFWMLVGFELFKELRRRGYECIETYPNAIVHELGCTKGHKSTTAGFEEQVSRCISACHLDRREFLASITQCGYGARHDRLDAFLSAWSASLSPAQRKLFGQVPNDAIVVPKIASTK